MLSQAFLVVSLYTPAASLVAMQQKRALYRWLGEGSRRSECEVGQGSSTAVVGRQHWALLWAFRLVLIYNHCIIKRILSWDANTKNQI